MNWCITLQIPKVPMKANQASDEERSHIAQTQHALGVSPCPLTISWADNAEVCKGILVSG